MNLKNESSLIGIFHVSLIYVKCINIEYLSDINSLTILDNQDMKVVTTTIFNIWYDGDGKWDIKPNEHGLLNVRVPNDHWFWNSSMASYPFSGVRIRRGLAREKWESKMLGGNKKKARAT
jgi:hypothetical protein